MNDQQKQQLLALARQAIASKWSAESIVMPGDTEFEKKCGLFVSLHKGDDLRGCIGYIRSYKSIADSVVEMAKAAAFRDPRFPAVGQSELEKINIEISLMSELIEVKTKAEIVIGRDGLYLEHPMGSGLLLPQVAVSLGWDRDEFLLQTYHKAGLSYSHIDDGKGKLFRFSAEIFGEEHSF